MSQLIGKTKTDVYPFISPLHALKDSAAGKVVLVTGGGKGIGKVRSSSHFSRSVKT